MFQLLFTRLSMYDLGCLMMHDMRDLQCLNVGITPGCYTHAEARVHGGVRRLRRRPVRAVRFVP